MMVSKIQVNIMENKVVRMNIIFFKNNMNIRVRIKIIYIFFPVNKCE